VPNVVEATIVAPVEKGVEPLRKDLRDDQRDK
jgi:hypothetical protein